MSIVKKFKQSNYWVFGSIFTYQRSSKTINQDWYLNHWNFVYKFIGQFPLWYFKTSGQISSTISYAFFLFTKFINKFRILWLRGTFLSDLWTLNWLYLSKICSHQICTFTSNLTSFSRSFYNLHSVMIRLRVNPIAIVMEVDIMVVVIHQPLLYLVTIKNFRLPALWIMEILKLRKQIETGSIIILEI